MEKEIKELQNDIHKGFGRVEKKIVEVDTKVDVLGKSTKDILDMLSGI